MHLGLTASSGNSLRSAFAQLLAAASENKESPLAAKSDQSVRDSDRIRSTAMLDSLERKRTGTGLVPKKKAGSIPPKLTEAEQDLLAHMEQGYQLETDSLGGNPVLRRLEDDEAIRPLSANRNTVKALEERGLIHPGKGREPLTMVWHTNMKR